MRRLALTSVLLTLTACGGGGGGGGGPAPAPAPVVTACTGPLASAVGGVVTVTGTDFPGAVGAPVSVRLRVADGKPFGGCGETSVTFAGTGGVPEKDVAILTVEDGAPVLVEMMRPEFIAG